MFGEVAYIATTPTSLRTTDNEFYTLESIVNLWTNRNASHANYVIDMVKRNLTPVTLIQRLVLLSDWLNFQANITILENIYWTI